MPLAPIGDPRRPLQLAIRSSRLLGIVFTLIGAAALAVFAMMWSPLPNRMAGMSMLAAILPAMFYLPPGVTYLVFAYFLGKRQSWAIVATMVLAGLHGLLAMFLCFAGLIHGNMIVFWICLIWLLAMAQLMYHLAKSFESIRADAEFSPRGFEPLAPGTYPIQPPSSPPRY